MIKDSYLYIGLSIILLGTFIYFVTEQNKTNEFINDFHQGKTGHEVQANLFYNHIINNNRKWTSL